MATRDNVTTGPNSGYVTQSADSPSSYHTLSLKWIGTVLDFHDKIALVRCFCLKSGLFLSSAVFKVIHKSLYESSLLYPTGSEARLADAELTKESLLLY